MKVLFVMKDYKVFNMLTGFSVIKASSILDIENKLALDNRLFLKGTLSELSPQALVLAQVEKARDRYGEYWEIQEARLARHEETTPFQRSQYLTSLGATQKVVGVFEADKKPYLNLIGSKEHRDRLLAMGRKAGNQPTVRKVLNQLAVEYGKNEIFRNLAPFGGNLEHVDKLWRRFRFDALPRLAKNTYVIGGYAGLSLESLDLLSAQLGYDQKDVGFFRAQKLVESKLESVENSGDTYLFQEDIFLKKQESPNLLLAIGLSLHEKIRTGRIDGKMAYFFDETRELEESLARDIKRLSRSKAPLPYKEELIEQIEKDQGISYSEEQRRAFGLFQSSGIKVLLGGPGTGKTTTLEGMIAFYEKMNPDHQIALCAPTGRAGQRMSEVTKREAHTIHRLIEYRPLGFENDVRKASYRNQNDPLAADLVVCDEASMLNNAVASMLLGAMKNGTTLLLVGDTGQLPAIGPGDVLGNIISSGLAELNALKKTFRQKGDSAIVENANKVREGIYPLREASDFSTLTYEQEEELVAALIYRFCRAYDVNKIFDLQILTQTRKHQVLGASNINRRIQEQLKRRGVIKGKPISYGDYSFYCNDKVILNRNNYADGYFNGDIGLIISQSQTQMEIGLPGDRVVVVSKDNYKDLELAYAITIHKSQGSEFKTALVVMGDVGSSLTNRNLYYTAITRGKSRVETYAVRDSVARAIGLKMEGTRKTSLLMMLEEEER